jgi:hypothetical protein
MTTTSAASGATYTATDDNPGWHARPRTATAIRIAVYALPVLVGAIAAVLLHLAVPRPTGGPILALWWVVGIAWCATVVGWVYWYAQRALPLASLLRLSLVFPETTPSRFRVARAAGSSEAVDDRLEELYRGAADSPLAAAAEAAVMLSAALDEHDRITRGHSDRVRELADRLGRQLGVSAIDRERLRWAALLHDCGKLSVDGAILNKAGPLDDREWDAVRAHPTKGDELIEPLRMWLGPWALTVIEHHERWDGAGYPEGLRGHEISLGARIVAVTDSFDVMTSFRSYKRPISPAAARAELTRCAGSQFDPEVVRAFLRVSTRRLERLWPLAVIGQIPLSLWLTGATSGMRRLALRATSTAATGAAVLASAAVMIGAGPLASPSIVAKDVTPHSRLPELAIPIVSPAPAVVAAVGDARVLEEPPSADPPPINPTVSTRPAAEKPALPPTSVDHLIDLDVDLKPLLPAELVVKVLPGLTIKPILGR